MNAQIKFLDGTYSLIHIPLALYSTFLQPILQVLLPQSQGELESSSRGLTVDGQHGFLNISVTPMECSIVCHSSWVGVIFERAASLNASETISISEDSYAVISVIAGMDAGSRVVDLTTPLAVADIPIFFITTYFCDFIMVPTRDRGSVVHALISRGFVFSEDESSFKSSGGLSSQQGTPHSRFASSSAPPSQTALADTAQLQNRTFELLRGRGVVPRIEPGLRLVQCSGRSDQYHQSTRSASRNRPRRQSWVDVVDAKLYTGLVTALVSQPRFLSLTLSQDDAPSLLLDRTLLPMFGDALVGDTEGDMVAIFLDLVNLSFEATGIVSGVAGKLVQEMKKKAPEQPVELSYLSTARAGAVVLSGDEALWALEVLQPLLAKEESENSS
ncbi:hypothetical protein VTK73DRAFT_8711 [Phialemonium thermophilum]|uniref:CASTOR ACT domain-containing protein n=1 Tax=Phialemonium thermophilum TaxID=223376 RepID=A0ABR3W6Y0_9PEZI